MGNGKNMLENWYTSGNAFLPPTGWPVHHLTARITGIVPFKFVTYLSDFFNAHEYFKELNSKDYPLQNIFFNRNILQRVVLTV
jgi:hypothetical protein